MGTVTPLHDRTGILGGFSDEALVLRALDGQRHAREELFKRHARRAVGLAHRLLASGASDVDDLVQDAFVAALEQLHTLRTPAAFGSWLGAIVVRMAAKTIRRRRLQRRLGLLRTEEFDFDPVASPETPPDVAVELRRFYACLRQLRAEERVALVLRYVDGLQVNEVAEMMGQSLSTTKRRLRSGETRMQRIMTRGSVRLGVESALEPFGSMAHSATRSDSRAPDHDDEGMLSARTDRRPQHAK